MAKLLYYKYYSNFAPSKILQSKIQKSDTMQSKGAIKVFTIAFALVCLFQLSFTFVSRKVDHDARRYAREGNNMAEAERLSKGNPMLQTYFLDSIATARENYYIDSIGNKVVYNILVKKYTYKDIKEREINLGLDLKGGMNVIMEVSIGDMITALAGPNNVNPVFQQTMRLARQRELNSQKDFVTLFGEAFAEIDPNAKLASIFNTVELKDKISYNSTNDDVLKVLRSETTSSFDRTYQILRTRIDRFGVTQPNVQKLAGRGRILVELPGIKDPARVRKLLQGTAKLEFWETYQYTEVYPYFMDANKRIKSILASEGIGDTTAAASKTSTAQTGEKTGKSANNDLALGSDTTKTDTSILNQLGKDTSNVLGQEKSFDQYAKENPLNAYLSPAFIQSKDGKYYPSEGATVGYAKIKDTANVDRMLRMVDNVFPRNLKLAWTNKPRDITSDVLELVALKVTSRDGTAALGGDVVVDAKQDYDQNGNVEVTLNMNSEGARVWKRLTGDNIGKQIAIVLDNYVYSFPSVRGEIAGGRSSISGGAMTIEEAQDLANILKAGKLPAPARIVQEAVVGPSLGQEAINASVWSFFIAFALVLFYMVFFYHKAGWVANIALFVNIFFIFGILASLGAVLTLPGIAGIVLTMGMAVDANVIIYERIKEEIRAGKGMRLAIADGFKHAYSAIIDGNVTTLITAVILYIFGTGPVKGFATTLIIGLLSSLFTAIFISRLIFTWGLDTNKKITFSYPFTQNFLQNTNINFIGLRKYAYLFSTTIIVIGIISLTFRGLSLGIDFAGGRTFVVRFDQNVRTNDIRKALEAEFPGAAPEVKTFGPSTQVKITTKYMINDNSPGIDSLVQTKLYAGLKPFYQNQSLSFKSFSSEGVQGGKVIGVLSSEKVGPTIATDIRYKAIMAVFFSLIGIFIYIAIRFKKWQFGLGGLASLAHDTFFTVSLFSIFYGVVPFSLDIDQAFIAAVLTIIGYSINDTVIIYDRIREYNTLFPKKDLMTNMNNAMNHTLSRTVNTVGTVLVVLIAMFLFGGEVIRGLTFALMVGVFFGTYSSVFIASPITYDLLSTPQQEGKTDPCH